MKKEDLEEIEERQAEQATCSILRLQYDCFNQKLERNRRIKLNADKGYDTKNHAATLRQTGVTPSPTQKSGRNTTAFPDLSVNQRAPPVGGHSESALMQDIVLNKSW